MARSQSLPQKLRSSSKGNSPADTDVASLEHVQAGGAGFVSRSPKLRNAPAGTRLSPVASPGAARLEEKALQSLGQDVTVLRKASSVEGCSTDVPDTVREMPSPGSEHSGAEAEVARAGVDGSAADAGLDRQADDHMASLNFSYSAVTDVTQREGLGLRQPDDDASSPAARSSGDDSPLQSAVAAEAPGLAASPWEAAAGRRASCESDPSMQQEPGFASDKPEEAAGGSRGSAGRRAPEGAEAPGAEDELPADGPAALPSPVSAVGLPVAASDEAAALPRAATAASSAEGETFEATFDEETATFQEEAGEQEEDLEKHEVAVEVEAPLVGLATGLAAGVLTASHKEEPQKHDTAGEEEDEEGEVEEEDYDDESYESYASEEFDSYEATGASGSMFDEGSGSMSN